MRVRVKAIVCALYYGILPWWMYENKKHFEGSYLHHLFINIGYAAMWLFFMETEDDRRFEKLVNNNF